jgi:hypothetical protein
MVVRPERGRPEEDCMGFRAEWGSLRQVLRVCPPLLLWDLRSRSSPSVCCWPSEASLLSPDPDRRRKGKPGRLLVHVVVEIEVWVVSVSSRQTGRAWRSDWRSHWLLWLWPKSSSNNCRTTLNDLAQNRENHQKKMSNTFKVDRSYCYVGTEDPSFLKDGHNDRDGVHEDLLRLLVGIMVVQIFAEWSTFYIKEI